MNLCRRIAVLSLIVSTGTAGACSSDESTDVPVRPAPPSRHAPLVDALVDDAESYAFYNGDWEEDLGDAPFYGVAWLARRAESGKLDAEEHARLDAAVMRAKMLVAGDLAGGAIRERVMASLGLIEYVGASRDRSVVPALDDFIDRLDTLTRTFGDYIEVGADRTWELGAYGPTAMTALVALVEAQYALLVGGGRAQERTIRALAIDARIRERAFGELVDAPTGRKARAYAFAPGDPGIFDGSNVAMLVLKSRLFRLTKREEFRLEARALYAALQPLKLADAPARYSSPAARRSLGVDTRDLSTLSSQNDLTLGLLLLFEITGDQRFVDEADRMLDGIFAMRGPWCTSHAHDPRSCSAACAAGQACVEGGCSANRCTTGLLHHVVAGRLALPEDGNVFCSGCNLQTLYVTGYRRTLAGETY